MGVLEVKDRVQRMLADIIGSVSIDKDGDFNFAYESTRVFVSVREWTETDTIVRVFAIPLWEVPGSPELFKHIATTALDYRFGALALYERPDGNFNVNFGHALLGETLDPDELKHVVWAIAGSADTIDDELAQKFGGKRWVDYD